MTKKPELYYYEGRVEDDGVRRLVEESGLEVNLKPVASGKFSIDDSDEINILSDAELSQLPYLVANGGQRYNGRDQIKSYIKSQAPESSQ